MRRDFSGGILGKSVFYVMQSGTMRRKGGWEMGIYLNPGNEGFQNAIHSEIYVDKTGLIAYTNAVLNTEQKYICVSRPRRFGKSMAANMLAAYYDKGEESKHLFNGVSV